MTSRPESIEKRPDFDGDPVMDFGKLEETVKNIDRRLANVEQKMPFLATKDELREEVAKLATKDELREEVAKLATKEDLREQSERLERHSQVLYESLHQDIQLVAEHLVAHMDRQERENIQHRRELKRHDGRLLALEAWRHGRS